MKENYSVYQDSGIVSHEELSEHFSEYKRPNDKISYMIENGNLIPLKRGLYVLNNPFVKEEVSNMAIANAIYAPSYVSFNSALSHYGITNKDPDSIQSATIKRKNIFKNSYGVFNYIKVRKDTFYIGIRASIGDGDHREFIASPTKAICDIIWDTPDIPVYGSNSMKEFLLDEIGIKNNKLSTLDPEIIKKCMQKGNKKEELRFLLELSQK